jgi:putative SOS response-associated peptidase YedK
MCYAFTLLEPDAISYRYAATFPSDWIFHPTYYLNAYEYPTYPVLTNNCRNQFQFMQWGLIPFWVKNKTDAESIRKKTINARAETIFEKPSFQYAVVKRRCLIPADGFYEWRYFMGKNYPYYIFLKNHEIFSFAGIYEQWMDKETNKELYTFSLITCDANPLMKKIHNKKKRMPVILTKKNEMKWLDDGFNKEELQQLLVPISDESMEAYTISKRLTRRTEKRNVKEVIEPYEYPELPKI